MRRESWEFLGCPLMARNVLLKRSAAHVTARGPARSPVWAPRLDFYLRPIQATYPVWNYKPMWIAKAFFGVLLMLSLASCGESKEAQPTIAIQRSAPSGDHPLVVGETTRFSIEIRAQNFQGPGHVGLVIQTAEGAVLVASDPTPIDAGQIVQLEASVTVPKTASVRVFTPLFIGDKMQTSVLDTRIYKVL